MARRGSTAQDEHQQALQVGVEMLLGSGLYADIRFTCEGRSFPAHRAIVCPRSPVIQRMLKEGKGKFQEADTRVVAVDEFNVATLKRMLQYLYTLDYDDGRDTASIRKISLEMFEPDTWDTFDTPNRRRSDYTAHQLSASPNKSSSHGADSDTRMSGHFDITNRTGASGELFGMATVLINNVDVYAIADYYDMTLLKNLAVSKFDDLLTAYEWVSEGFLDVLQHIYQKAPEKDCALRDMAVQAAGSNLQDLVRTYGDRLPEAICGESDFPGDLLAYAVGGYESKLNFGKVELQAARAALNSTVIELRGTRTELEATKRELETTRADLSKARIEPDKARTELTKSRVGHDKTKSELVKARIELDKMRNEVKKFRSKGPS